VAMEARVHRTSAEFREAAWPLLSADPVRNTVALIAMPEAGEDTLMISLHDNGNVVGAVLRFPPWPLIVTAMPVQAAELVAKTVHGIDPALPAASGVLDRIEAFTAAWTSLTGTKAELRLATRLFQLGELSLPEVAGQARHVTEADLPLLTEWRGHFMVDMGMSVPAETVAEQARQSLESGHGNVFWEVDGEPVAFAAARGPVLGMVRVAPVYTPEEHRGHGYASGATAAVSQWAIDQGAEHILLYTDLENETTNRIYPRIGYRPVEDFGEYTFS
jgi:RimJ/RimL family protein N-acetyltransferase